MPNRLTRRNPARISKIARQLIRKRQINSQTRRRRSIPKMPRIKMSQLRQTRKIRNLLRKKRHSTPKIKTTSPSKN